MSYVSGMAAFKGRPAAIDEPQVAVKSDLPPAWTGPCAAYWLPRERT